MRRFIPLSKGFKATIDEDDWERCSDHNWFLEVKE